MGRARDSEPVAPKAPDSEADPERSPAGDSAGTYYLSIEDFESRLPRPAPLGERDEESG